MAIILPNQLIVFAMTGKDALLQRLEDIAFEGSDTLHCNYSFMNWIFIYNVEKRHDNRTTWP